MCDDHVAWWSRSEHTARTWKRCCECGGLIAPGDRYVKHAWVNDGEFESSSAHAPCDAAADEIAEATDEDGCRMLGEAARSVAGSAGMRGELRAPLAVLAWMRTRSRARFA